MNKTILVIDDDESILEAVKLMLEVAGYGVDTLTKNGQLLKKRLAKGFPNLILLDVLLSGFDGRHIAKELKTNKKTTAIPLIMMSAHPHADRTCLEAGADAFIAKPFDIDDLLGMVEKYMA